MEACAAFCRDLHRSYPQAIVVSGGAKGIDLTAERTWYQLGGQVWSYRSKKLAEGKFVVERWEYRKGGSITRYPLHSEPSWADFASANWYRSMLVAELADRIVAFHGSNTMRGTEFTVWVAREAERKPVHIWKDGAWA